MLAQITAIVNPTNIFKASIVPTPDATDFPPLNCKKIGLECPNITKIEAETARIPYVSAVYKAASFAKRTGTAPLITSRIKTIKNHLNSAFHKLGVTSRTEAVVKAIKLGIISSDK